MKIVGREEMVCGKRWFATESSPAYLLSEPVARTSRLHLCLLLDFLSRQIDNMEAKAEVESPCVDHCPGSADISKHTVVICCFFLHFVS